MRIICEDHVEMPLLDMYVLGTGTLKFSLNLRIDRNENTILFTSELENVLTSFQLHFHHLPAMYISLNVICLGSYNQCR